MRVLIVGNSVPLRVRPSTLTPKSYPKILANDDAIDVKVLGKGALTTRGALDLTDQIISEAPDVIVLNLGIVDCCTRPIGIKTYAWLTKPSKPSLIRTICQGIESKFRRSLVLLRGKKPWISLSEFEYNLNNLISSVKKDCNSRFIILGINNCDDRIEKQLPGTGQYISRYNSFLGKMVVEKGVLMMDPNELMNTDYTPDGVHYSPAGHEIVAKKILELIWKK